jgi:hypothetical protein
MPNDFGPWERVASELRAYREAQRQAWGDLDNATLGRYLAGDVTAEERLRIESALEERPELRKLTDLVSDVLRDCEPVVAPTDVARPAVLPFRPAAPKRMTQPWRRWAPIAAAACLLIALGAGLQLPKNGPKPSIADDLTHMDSGSDPDVPIAFHEVSVPGALQTPSDVDAKSAEKTAAAISTALNRIDPVALCADGLCSAAASYEQHGDLDMAAFSYHLAYNIRESHAGADAPMTLEVRRNLGEVYQTALALADDVAAKRGPPEINPAPADPPHLHMSMAKKLEVRDSALQLADRITRQNVRDVRKSVVPVLVENLREAQTPEAREQLGRALAELGPAADDAIPVLNECLQKAQTPQERAVVLRALGELGQTAGPAAAPVLVTSMKSSSSEERRAAEDALANYGPVARDVVAKCADAPAEHKEWTSLKERLLGVEGRIGVRDGCELFSILAVKAGQREIRELARMHHVEVFAETRPNPKPGDSVEAAKDRAREIDVNGVYFVMHPSPAVAEVYIGDALRDQGFDDAHVVRLRQVIADAVGRQDFDAGLLEGVRFVVKFAAGKDKKPGTDSPPPP